MFSVVVVVRNNKCIYRSIMINLVSICGLSLPYAVVVNRNSADITMAQDMDEVTLATLAISMKL